MEFVAAAAVIFLTKFLCQAICTQRTPKRPKNRLNEHGIYIRHCQESNSQPVPSQAGADPTRPQWGNVMGFLELCYWIKSYFDSRTQFVRIQNQISETNELSTGVPQFSCLGLLLLRLHFHTDWHTLFLRTCLSISMPTTLIFTADLKRRNNEMVSLLSRNVNYCRKMVSL